MVTLKNKIKVIDSLPPENNKKTTTGKIIATFITIIILGILIFTGYKLLMPYFNAVDINKIIGKRINITKCNTKDYIITLDIEGTEKVFTRADIAVIRLALEF